jgi:hypothetical protein
MNFGVNHLGTFLLTMLLLDVILKTPKSRILVIASSWHHNIWQRPDYENLAFD